MVQGIAQQTFRDASGGRDTVEAFRGRLRALAGAHDLLTRESWVSADLAAIAAEALDFGGSEPRIAVGGPPVTLSSKQAVTVAMALHELLANSLEHGALSRPEGRITLAWEIGEAPGRRPPEPRLARGRRPADRAAEAVGASACASSSTRSPSTLTRR